MKGGEGKEGKCRERNGKGKRSEGKWGREGRKQIYVSSKLAAYQFQLGSIELEKLALMQGAEPLQTHTSKLPSLSVSSRCQNELRTSSIHKPLPGALQGIQSARKGFEG